MSVQTRLDCVLRIESPSYSRPLRTIPVWCGQGLPGAELQGLSAPHGIRPRSPQERETGANRRNRTGSAYDRNSLRRTVPARAINPAPNNTSVPGSGVLKWSWLRSMPPFPSLYH